MDTKFARFIRSGGYGYPYLSVKADVPGLSRLRTQFEANLVRAEQINVDLILRFTRDEFTPPLTPQDLADVGGDMDAALSEWDRRIEFLWREAQERPSRFATLRRAMEENLITSFAALINERRQRGLGIDQYTWRSSDDDRVRGLHQRYDDKIFDWDAPPEDGHPGQAFNCRCFAEPLILDAPEYVPLSDREFARAISDAELDGNRRANQNALTSLADSLTEIPGFIDAASRFLELRNKQKNGELSADEATELADLQAVIDARAAGVEAFLKDIPGALAQPFRYRQAIARQANEVAVAYLEGRATEGQLIAAFRDKGFVERSLILGVLPFAAALRLPSGRIRLPTLPDREALGQFWRRAIGATEFRRIGADWEVVDNPGIRFGGPIKEQGGPWEDFLETSGGLGLRTPETFKTFDFFDPVSQTATSAKTLNTRARSYVDRESRIFGRIKRYIDQVDQFEGDIKRRFKINPEDIATKRLELAVPANSTTRQIFQIQRAIDHAESLGIDLIVRFVR